MCNEQQNVVKKVDPIKAKIQKHKDAIAKLQLEQVCKTLKEAKYPFVVSLSVHSPYGRTESFQAENLKDTRELVNALAKNLK